MLFIQKSKVDELKKKSSGEEFTVQVDDSFQYGQDKNKTKRWLAFHDKSFGMYQASDLAGQAPDTLPPANLYASIVALCLQRHAEIG